MKLKEKLNKYEPNNQMMKNQVMKNQMMNNQMMNNQMKNNPMMNNQMMNNQMMNNQMMNNPMMNNQMMNNQMMNNPMMNNPMMKNQMMNNQMMNNPMMNNQMMNNQMMNNQMMNNQMMNNQMMKKQMMNNPMMNNQMMNNKMMNNQWNPMNMNMINMGNPWNMMYNPINQNLNSIENDDPSMINLIFRLGQRVISELCNYNEKVIEVTKRVSKKLDINHKQCKFVFNGKQLNPNINLAESGLQNMSNILIIALSNNNNIVNKKNEYNYENSSNIAVRFRTLSGSDIVISVEPEISIEKLIIKFFNRIDRPDLINSDNVSFLYHALKLNAHDQTKVKQYFKNDYNPTILVNDTTNLIGA